MTSIREISIKKLISSSLSSLVIHIYLWVMSLPIALAGGDIANAKTAKNLKQNNVSCITNKLSNIKAVNWNTYTLSQVTEDKNDIILSQVYLLQEKLSNKVELSECDHEIKNQMKPEVVSLFYDQATTHQNVIHNSNPLSLIGALDLAVSNKNNSLSVIPMDSELNTSLPLPSEMIAKRKSINQLDMAEIKNVLKKMEIETVNHKYHLKTEDHIERTVNLDQNLLEKAFGKDFCEGGCDKGERDQIQAIETPPINSPQINNSNDTMFLMYDSFFNDSYCVFSDFSLGTDKLLYTHSEDINTSAIVLASQLGSNTISSTPLLPNVKRQISSTISPANPENYFQYFYPMISSDSSEIFTQEQLKVNKENYNNLQVHSDMLDKLSSIKTNLPKKLNDIGTVAK